MTQFDRFPTFSWRYNNDLKIVYDQLTKRLVRVSIYGNQDKFYNIQVYDKNQNRNLAPIKLTSSATAIDDWIPVSHEVQFGAEEYYSPKSVVFDFKTLKVKNLDSVYLFLTKVSSGERLLFDGSFDCFRKEICSRLVEKDLPIIGDEYNKIVYLDIFLKGKKISRSQVPSNTSDVELHPPYRRWNIKRTDSRIQIDLSIKNPGETFQIKFYNEIDPTTGQLLFQKWNNDRESTADFLFDSNFRCINRESKSITSGIAVQDYEIHFLSDSLLNTQSVSDDYRVTTSWYDLKTGKTIGSCINCEDGRLIKLADDQKNFIFWEEGSNGKYEDMYVLRLE